MKHLRIQTQKALYILMMIFFVSLSFMVSCGQDQMSFPDLPDDWTHTPPVQNLSSLTLAAKSFGAGESSTKTIEILYDGTLTFHQEDEERLPPDFEVNIIESDFTATLNTTEMGILYELMDDASIASQTDINLSSLQDPFFICDYTTDYDVTHVSDSGVVNTFSISTYCLSEHLSDEMNEFIEYVNQLVDAYDEGDDDNINNNEDDIICTQQTVPSVRVYIYDENGDTISDATVSLTQGDFGATLTFMDYSEYNTNPDHEYSGVYESAGTFELKVEKEDYITHVQEVEVASNVCHVETEEVTVNLLPQP